jgi:hypothetical protein
VFGLQIWLVAVGEVTRLLFTDWRTAAAEVMASAMSVVRVAVWKV